MGKRGEALRKPPVPYEDCGIGCKSGSLLKRGFGSKLASLYIRAPEVISAKPIDCCLARLPPVGGRPNPMLLKLEI